MFKKLLSDNRIFGALVCALVFIAAGLLYLNRVKSQSGRDVQRTQETVKDLETPKTEGQPAPGGHYHPDGTYHVGPHEAEIPSGAMHPATPPEETPRGNKFFKSPQQTGTATNTILSAPTQGQRLTAEQVVVYTTLINEYEKEALEFQRLSEITRAELAEIEAASEAYRKKMEANGIGVLTNRADYEAGRITSEEYHNRYSLLHKEYKEVLPQEAKRNRERSQAFQEKLQPIIIDEKAHRARAPGVERARRLLEAHINAD